jgi:hypothetical protein
MALTSKRQDEVKQAADSGAWRAVLYALESNIKTARLVLIILAVAVLAAAAR